MSGVRNQGDLMTFQEIADEIGISRQGVKHVYDKAIRKIRGDAKLKEYWHFMLLDSSSDLSDVLSHGNVTKET